MSQVIGQVWREVVGCRNWPVMRVPLFIALQRNAAHKGQWRRALMFSLIGAWTNGWVNNRDAGDLRRHRARYDATVMEWMDEWQWHFQEMYNVLKCIYIYIFIYISLKVAILSKVAPQDVHYLLVEFIYSVGTNHTKARVVRIFMDMYNTEREMVLTRTEWYFQGVLWFITVKPII